MVGYLHSVYIETAKKVDFDCMLTYERHIDARPKIYTFSKHNFMSFHIQLMSTCWLLSPAVDTVMMEVHSLSCLDSQLSSLLCVCLRICVRHCTISLSVARKLKPEPARHRGEGQRTLVELVEFCTYIEADSTNVSHEKVKNMFKSNCIVPPNQKIDFNIFIPHCNISCTAFMLILCKNCKIKH